VAELTLFNYRSGNSTLHQFDVRFKIVALLIISITSLHLGALSLAILSLPVILLMVDSGLTFGSFFREIRFFVALWLIILLAQTLSSEGAHVYRFYILPFSLQGFFKGVLICWRLLLILSVGLLFIMTTRTSEIRAAVQWFLNPVPFVSGKRLATMLSLLMRFIPMIVNQAKETSDAQKARCVENRKNPVYRLLKFGFPLLRGAFENADRLIIAMEARCYNDRRTDPDLSSSSRDWLKLLMLSTFCGGLLII
jgi:energy-coupling factor transporter transmembrane protein EcfT